MAYSRLTSNISTKFQSNLRETMEQVTPRRGRNNSALWPWLLATDRLLSNIQRFLVETCTANTAHREEQVLLQITILLLSLHLSPPPPPTSLFWLLVAPEECCREAEVMLVLCWRKRQFAAIKTCFKSDFWEYV